MANITFSSGTDFGILAQLWNWWPAKRRARQEEIRNRIGHFAKQLLSDLGQLSERYERFSQSVQRASCVFDLRLMKHGSDGDTIERHLACLRDLEHQVQNAAQRLSFLQGSELEKRRKALLVLAAATDEIIGQIDELETYWDSEQKMLSLPMLV